MFNVNVCCQSVNVVTLHVVHAYYLYFIFYCFIIILFYSFTYIIIIIIKYMFSSVWDLHAAGLLRLFYVSSDIIPLATQTIFFVMPIKHL